MKNAPARRPLFGFLNALAALAFVLAGLFSFFAMGWMSFRSAAAILGFAAAAGIAAVAATMALAGRQVPAPWPKADHFRVLGAILLAGIAVRIAWVIAVPPVQISDFKDYLDAARQWIASGVYSYEVRGHILYACRPPGYPMFLVACMSLLGDHPWVPAFENIALFLATALMAYRIASLLTGNRQAGLWAALLLAIWPSSIHYTGLAASEPLSLALFTAVFWTYLEADRRAGNASAFAWAGVCGLLIGFGALVKPQMQMFPVLLFLAWLASPGRKAAKAAHIAIALLAMLCAIAPWSYRNYKLFHHFLAISSNGGDVFYRANNPLATGDFTPVGERSLDPYLDDELEWNRMGFAWGKEWIRSHPVAFVKLSFQKVAHFLGDDASGAYWTLQRGHGKQGAGYLAWVIFSDAFWVGIWILALAGVAKFRSVIADSDHYGLMLWMALFFVTAHSIFESHSRYHQPMLGLLAVLAALGLVRSSPEPAPPVSA